ncbi:MAG: hypothetical protein J3Q66DRAFT_429554 [Benniella sp.]|nr:MAG: hypothetical protein J3Q66DRAFT_429554 [Benniella sp.]
MSLSVMAFKGFGEAYARCTIHAVEELILRHPVGSCGRSSRDDNLPSKLSQLHYVTQCEESNTHLESLFGFNPLAGVAMLAFKSRVLGQNPVPRSKQERLSSRSSFTHKYYGSCHENTASEPQDCKALRSLLPKLGPHDEQLISTGKRLGQALQLYGLRATAQSRDFLTDQITIRTITFKSSLDCFRLDARSSSEAYAKLKKIHEAFKRFPTTAARRINTAGQIRTMYYWRLCTEPRETMIRYGVLEVH